MPPQLIEPRDKYLLKRHTTSHEAVLGHLNDVLKVFAVKPEFTQFYIGITNDVDTRLYSHQQRKPAFRLMVPVYEEQAFVVESALDQLEGAAIRRFRDGIRHPDTRQLLLRCANGPDGPPPKTTLYILVG